MRPAADRAAKIPETCRAHYNGLAERNNAVNCNAEALLD
jgi:hypothetical protein